MYDFHDPTDTYSEQKNRLLIKLSCFSSDLVHMGDYNFTKYHQIQIKNIKVLIIARFSVQNFKVSVESLKSYIVTTWGKNRDISLHFSV